jgi:DNA-binding NarL/FixJ family response regulator
MPLRLVLIEDHQALREGLELLLDREGCRVVGTAGDAAHGRTLVERLDPDVALIDSGARGYALKEGTPSELTTALTMVAEGGTYVDPRLHPALLSRRATQTQKSLSKREREIMDLLAQGLTGEQVAERLYLSPETIKTHIRNAMSKLEANTRVHAIAIALREGYISPPTQPSGRP